MAHTREVLVAGTLTLLLAGCELAGDLIEFGFWTGVALLIAAGLLIGWLWRRWRRPRGGNP